MSLTGNLEDLPLLDIIQIVSFSKKTGYLTIRREQGDAAIVFEDGNVVASYTPESPPPDPRAAALPPEQRASVVRNRIEIALEQLIRLRDGQFNFSLTGEPPTRLGSRDLTHEMLRGGINAQELLLDLARGIDEDRRDSSAALEASFAGPHGAALEEETGDEAERAEVAAFLRRNGSARPVSEPSPFESTLPVSVPPAPAEAPGAAAPEPAPEPAAAPVETPPAGVRTILLVDDEDDVRRVLGDRFSDEGYQVVEAEDPESAVQKASRLGKSGIPFLLVTDLGMPTTGGSSFQGGFEVVKRLSKANLRPPVLMMTDSFDPVLKTRARQMGVASFIFKPGLSKLDSQQFEADLKAFAEKILRDVLPALGRPRAEVAQAAKHAEGPGAPGAAAESSPEELSRQFQMLQERLEDLRRTTDPTQISALVMRVAREFFERAVLFLVKNEQVRGLGGFGLAPRDQTLGLLVRDIVIPLSEPSAFLDVVTRRKPFYGPLPPGSWSQYLAGRLGRFKSSSAALLPLVAHRDAIALLYGDNPETGTEIRRLEALEVFIHQAGVALESAFLQRKIGALQGESQR